MPLRPPPRTPLRLRQRFDGLAAPAVPRLRDAVTFGLAPIDTWLGGGLVRGALHEVFAASPDDAATALGFAAMLAQRAGRAGGRQRILWVRHAASDARAGQLYPLGLAALGLNPAHLVLVRAADVLGVLRAAAEAARSTGLAAVLLELWGEAALLDLTASRRLSLAAEETATTVLLLRVAATPVPSAAASRWMVGALPSRPLAANAPGRPALAATLLRHRGGAAVNTWHLEWDHEQRCFRDYDAAAQPGAVVSLPAGRAVGLAG